MTHSPRSPELLSRSRSALLVIDVQVKLLPAVAEGRSLCWNLRRLADGARLFEVPVAGTEQYPRGLGGTEPEVDSRLDAKHEKTMFSCRACGELTRAWRDEGRFQIVAAGIEAHVCVLQTVLDLLSDGWQVHVVADAVSSRRAADREFALRRLDSAGAMLTTTESVLFQWCEDSADPQFRALSALIQEAPPEEA